MLEFCGFVHAEVLGPLERAVGLDELPLQVEFLGSFGSEGGDAEGFGGVVAAGIHVEPFFLGVVEVVLAKFAGDECIRSGRFDVFDSAGSAAGEYADAFGGAGAELHGGEFLAEETFQGRAEVGATTGPVSDEANVGSLVREEAAGGAYAELFGEDGVVADLGVGIEREMAGIDSEVSVDEGPDLFVLGPDYLFGTAPEHAVVHDEEIDFSFDRFLEGDEAGVHCGSDFCYDSVVGEL